MRTKNNNLVKDVYKRQRLPSGRRLLLSKRTKSFM